MHTPLQGGFHSSLYQSQVLVRVKPFYLLIFSHLRFDVIDRSAEIACTRVRKFDEEPPWNKRNRFYHKEEREDGEEGEEKNEYQRVGVRVCLLRSTTVYYYSAEDGCVYAEGIVTGVSVYHLPWCL